jgi:hypothetical protein
MTNDKNDTKNNVEGAIKADWEQTKSDMPGMDGKDLDQDVDDTVKQAAGKEEPPAV